MWSKRAAIDIEKLQAAGFPIYGEGKEEATLKNFCVTLKGPKDSPYENFEWDIRFTIPEQYPFKSPSVGFVQQIWHPNIDFESGTVCLDTLNTQWSPMFTLLSIVETQLPYLLNYPNPSDPLNRKAALEFMGSSDAFRDTANDYAKRCSKK